MMKPFFKIIVLGFLSPFAMAETGMEDFEVPVIDNSEIVASVLDTINHSDLSSEAKISASCKLQVLSNIGWKIEPLSSTDRIRVVSETSMCSKASPTLGVPLQILDSSNIENDLNVALKSDPSFCIYKKKLALAGYIASAKFSRNDQFVFRTGSDPLMVFPSTWSGNPNTLMQPQSSSAQAFESLYDSHVRTECWSALNARLGATQYELYKQDFDRVFLPEELSVGNLDYLVASKNIFLGDEVVNKFGMIYQAYDADWARLYPNATSEQFDPGAKLTAAKGKEALIGLPGFIGYRGEEHAKYLDDTTNRGQNFMILSTTDAAASQLAIRGTDGYNTIFEEVMKRYQKIYFKTKPDGELDRDPRGQLKDRYMSDAMKIWILLAMKAMNRWLDDENYGSPIPALPEPKFAPTDPTSEEYKNFFEEKNRVHQLMSEIMVLLNDRFLRDTQVAVHPHPRRSLAYYVIYQLSKNKRIPSWVVIYPNTVNSLMFWRWMEYKVEDCKLQAKAVK